MKRALLCLLSILAFGMMGSCAKDEPPPVAAPAEFPLTAWIYDGRRLLRYDLEQDVLTREHMPGASLPLDDAAPDGTSGLEAGNPDPSIERFMPSPDDRFLVYGLVVNPEAWSVRLYAWDRQTSSERFLGQGRYFVYPSLVRFLGGSTSVLVAADETGVAFFDLATGRSGRRDGVFCGGLTAGDRVLAEFATGKDQASCGQAVAQAVLSWDGSTIREVPLSLPWDDPQTFLVVRDASASEDGQVVLNLYRRDQPEESRHPLLRCDLRAAACLEIDARGWLDSSLVQPPEYRNLSRDGRTLTYVGGGPTRLRILSDGSWREIPTQEWITTVHSCDGASEVFVHMTTPTPASGESTMQQVARVGAQNGGIETVWSSSRSPTWEPLSLAAVSDAQDRLLVVEFKMDLGTDMVTYFPVQARLVNAATGMDSGPIGGGGVPSVWSRDLRRALVFQHRGPAGVTLVAGDPSGVLHPIASWKDPRKGVLLVASWACPSGTCPVQSCEAQAPLAEAPSVTLEGAGDTYDIAEDVTITALTDPASDAPGTLEVSGPSGTRRFIVDLPPPSRLPLSVGQAVSIMASRTPGAGDGPPRQVFAAWDPLAPDLRRVLFIGGSAVEGMLPPGAEGPSWGRIAFANTWCAPDEVAGCGGVEHPPLLFSPSSWWEPCEVQPGTECRVQATEQGGSVHLTVFSTARPADGRPCAALGTGTAYVLAVWSEEPPWGPTPQRISGVASQEAVKPGW